MFSKLFVLYPAFYSSYMYDVTASHYILLTAIVLIVEDSSLDRRAKLRAIKYLN